jgi:CBS domain-containing protein
MRVEERMMTNVGTMDADETVSRAALLMDEEGVDALFVRFDDKIVGAVRKEDLIRRALSAGWNPLSTMVVHVSTLLSESCRTTDDFADVASAMESANQELLLVLDGKGRSVGLLSREPIDGGREMMREPFVQGGHS